MEEQHTADDQSHYEISLTAAQAFVAFVLLLLSLAAAFAFGLMIGKGQADERLVVREKAPSAVTEASLTPKKDNGKIVELGVADDDFKEPETTEPAPTDTASAPVTETASPAATETAKIVESTPEPARTAPAPAPVTPAVHESSSPWFAQLLSTGDQKTAESLAARVIEGGFTSAYVERGSTDKGPVYRVRVKFASEGEARAAETKLRTFSKDVWITAK